MHAFIFYGFLCYGLHTVGQVIAGNAWYYFTKNGINPYLFQFSDFIWLGFTLTSTQAALAFVGILSLIVLTFYVMNSFSLGKKFNWRNNAFVEWFFLIILTVETFALFGILIGSGSHFYESVVEYFSIFVLLGLVFFGYRRWIKHDKGLDVPSTQSAIVLILIGTLMLSTLVGQAANFLINGGSGNWIEKFTLAILQNIGLNESIRSNCCKKFLLVVTYFYCICIYGLCPTF